MGKTIRIAVVLAAILLLSGCNKNKAHRGGEGTNFPYTWQEQSNGTVVIKLDGSYAPDYTWSAENSDETVIKVETAGKEKKGIVSYRVTPLAEGTASVTFIRRRDCPEDMTLAAETDAEDLTESLTAAENEGVTDGGTQVVDKGEAPSVQPLPVERMAGSLRFTGGEDTDGGSETAQSAETEVENGSDEASAYEQDDAYDWYSVYRERFAMKDTVSEITILFDVMASGKKGKLRAEGGMQFETEYKGLLKSEDAAVDYKLWEDETGSFILRIPFDTEPWTISWDGEYIPESAEQDGNMATAPEKVGGRYEIIRITREDALNGDECFEIRGLAPGNATAEFASAISGRKLVIEMTISKDGRITILSHRLEEYKP